MWHALGLIARASDVAYDVMLISWMSEANGDIPTGGGVPATFDRRRVVRLRDDRSAKLRGLWVPEVRR